MYLHLHAVDLARSPDGQWRVCWPIARRRRRAPATRSRIGSCCRGACPRRFAIARCSGWRRSSRASRQADGAGAAEPARPRRASCCSRRGRSTKPTSSTRISRAISASPSSKGRPHRARPPCLHQDARRPAAGGRDLPAARRQLLRSAGAAADSTLGVAGLMEAARAGTSRWPTRSAREWSRRRSRGVSARRCAAISSARSCSCLRRARGGAGTPTICSTCSRISTSW